MCSNSTNGGLALVWVDEGFGQRLVDMGTSSVPVEQFMHQEE